MQLTGHIHFVYDATGVYGTSPGNTRVMFADKNGNGIIEVTNNPATCFYSSMHTHKILYVHSSTHNHYPHYSPFQSRTR